MTAMFMEDLGTTFFESACNTELASKLGEDLAKMHRAYCYRTEELMQLNVLRTLLPSEYGNLVNRMISLLTQWKLASSEERRILEQLAEMLSTNLGGEPSSLVHGDLYAENIILRGGRMFIIDWSYFTILGVPLMDLATLTMRHHKNGRLIEFRHDLIDACCFESGRDREEVVSLLPFAETLSRLLFLDWLVERRHRGILGTTVGPVDELIPRVLSELSQRLAVIA
jgi:Ser/Thr protein kinase RdoA (MazF antagonist)